MAGIDKNKSRKVLRKPPPQSRGALTAASGPADRQRGGPAQSVQRHAPEGLKTRQSLSGVVRAVRATFRNLRDAISLMGPTGEVSELIQRPGSGPAGGKCALQNAFSGLTNGSEEFVSVDAIATETRKTTKTTKTEFARTQRVMNRTATDSTLQQNFRPTGGASKRSPLSAGPITQTGKVGKPSAFEKPIDVSRDDVTNTRMIELAPLGRKSDSGPHGKEKLTGLKAAQFKTPEQTLADHSSGGEGPVAAFDDAPTSSAPGDDLASSGVDSLYAPPTPIKLRNVNGRSPVVVQQHSRASSGVMPLIIHSMDATDSSSDSSIDDVRGEMQKGGGVQETGPGGDMSAPPRSSQGTTFSADGLAISLDAESLREMPDRVSTRFTEDTFHLPSTVYQRPGAQQRPPLTISDTSSKGGSDSAQSSQGSKQKRVSTRRVSRDDASSRLPATVYQPPGPKQPQSRQRMESPDRASQSSSSSNTDTDEPQSAFYLERALRNPRDVSPALNTSTSSNFSNFSLSHVKRAFRVKSDPAPAAAREGEISEISNTSDEEDRVSEGSSGSRGTPIAPAPIAPKRSGDLDLEDIGYLLPAIHTDSGSVPDSGLGRAGPIAPRRTQGSSNLLPLIDAGIEPGLGLNFESFSTQEAIPNTLPGLPDININSDSLFPDGEMQALMDQVQRRNE